MKIAVLSKEFPPHVYGGAGVHVDHLTRELAVLEGGVHRIQVLCFGEQQGVSMNRIVTGIGRDEAARHPDPALDRVLDALSRDIRMPVAVRGADLIHAHTWYTHLAGCLLKSLTGAPLVLTTHSLEPHRPWKREQLGRGYALSCWLEKTAYQNADRVIAVSGKMKSDVCTLYDIPGTKVEIIPNGIDGERYRHREEPAVLESYGIDPGIPYVLLVSRLTRQKGIAHFLNAAELLPPRVQAVLCADAPDTAAFLQEVERRVEALKRQGKRNVVWVRETVPVDRLVVLYSHAAVFVCPSIYEPFGLINLEAMACGTPVVASAIGGIPEVVVENETGKLVSFRPLSPQDPEPEDPQRFAAELAGAVTHLLDSPSLREEMGGKARDLVERRFTWRAVASQTLNVYKQLQNG